MRNVYIILGLATALTIAQLLFGPAVAKEVTMKVYNYEITRVIDGDTVVLAAPFLPRSLKKELSIRVYGVDTSEKGWRAECEAEAKWGEQASFFTKDQLNNAKRLQIAIAKWDKFGGRVLGDVIIDGKSLRHMLIEKGFAREYYGDKKESWC